MKKKLRIGVFFTILPPLFNKCCKDCLLFCWQIRFLVAFLHLAKAVHNPCPKRFLFADDK